MIAEIAHTDCEDETESLAHAAQQGDRHAFGRLFERHQKAVYATVYRRLENHADTEEVCQDVFLQAWVKIGQLSDPRRFSGWLQVIATRMSINGASRDRKNREIGSSDGLPNVYAKEAAPEAIAIAHERQAQVQQAMGRLKKADQEILKFVHIEDRLYREIGEQLGKPDGTIKRWAHEGRNRLKEELAAMGFA
jgi:RNA polymerase sigma-70 factor (ECF subfamily)